MPKVGITYLVDDGVVLPDDTVEGVVFNLEPRCKEVLAIEADALDARNGIFHPKQRVVFPDTGMKEGVAIERDGTACIKVVQVCVKGYTMYIACVFFVTIGIKKFAVLPDVVAASRYPTIVGEDQVVDNGAGVGAEDARVVHPNAPLHIGGGNSAACSINGSVCGNLKVLHLEVDAVRNAINQSVVFPNLACAVAIARIIDILGIG